MSIPGVNQTYVKLSDRALLAAIAVLKSDLDAAILEHERRFAQREAAPLTPEQRRAQMQIVTDGSR